MELGQRLRQARLEAGLSQRQLCGDQISRNMLSLIENGSARPSMQTLRYLAQQLGKPIGFFLEDQAVTSPNQVVMEQLRQAQGEQVLALLPQYREDDPVFDRERWLLEALACLQAAREALAAGKPGYCRSLLERCSQAGDKTPYYTPALERERLLLWGQVDPGSAAVLVQQLPDHSREVQLRAQGALDTGAPAQAKHILLGAPQETDDWYRLMGVCCMALSQFQEGAAYLERIGAHTRADYAALERCYQQLEDYKQAYFYACKQRE